MSGASARRRLVRLGRTGSPRLIARAVRREAWLRRERARLDAALAAGGPLVVGPFLGEVGFELLYWRPLVRRLLRSHGVDPARVTVVSRGGAGVWYRDVAESSLDVLELITPQELQAGIERRVARSGQRKQVDVDAFDRDVLARVFERTGPADVVHPLHMYWSFRFVWEGLEPPADALRHGDYDELERDPAVLDGIDLPDRFVAVKAYANECLPDTPETRHALGRALAAVTSTQPVVLLDAGVPIDDHRAFSVGGVLDVADRLDPARNLVQQAEIVARADVLVATYGGFSYLGPFYGVPTVALATVPEWNALHEQVLRAVRPALRYERAEPQDAATTLAGLQEAA
jgi:hypothetical protein